MALFIKLNEKTSNWWCTYHHILTWKLKMYSKPVVEYTKKEYNEAIQKFSIMCCVLYTWRQLYSHWAISVYFTLGDSYTSIGQSIDNWFRCKKSSFFKKSVKTFTIQKVNSFHWKKMTLKGKKYNVKLKK